MSADKKDKKPALGRGLGALLNAEATAAAVSGPVQQLPRIPVDAIENNPYQPRTEFEQKSLEELAQSIKIHGIIQPISVRRLGTGKYQLISGERRTRAARLAGLTEIPAYVIETDNKGMIEMAIIENIQREDLNAIEVAISFQRLMDECQLKQEELAGRVGKERSTVTNYLRLLRLPPDVQVAVRDGKISMGHARALAGLENIDHQLSAFKEIVQSDLSVRKAEELVRSLGQKTATSTKKQPVKTDPELPAQYRDIQNQLSSRFSSRINIRVSKEGKGEIVIPFLNTEDFNRLLELLEEV